MNDFGKEPNKDRNGRRPEARRPDKRQSGKSLEIDVTDYVTVAEAALQLRCCTKTVRNRIKEGKLEAYRHGGRILIPRSAIERLIKSGRIR
jgi:excisionase family DNA binding protein